MSFENAAVTKGLMITCALTSIFAGIFDIKHYFHLQFVPHISRHHQYWRLITHHLAFSNSSDLFLGELLLYNVGVHVERRFGSVKFASFAFVSLVVSTLLELLSILLFHRIGINHIAMGPSTLLFSILYQYYRIVPHVYTYRIFGVPLNNKSVLYFLALQLAIGQLPNSLTVAVVGALSGQIYRSDLAGFNTYRLPPAVVRLSERFLVPLVGSLRPPRRTNRALPDDTRIHRVQRSADSNDEAITTARAPRPSSAAARARTTAAAEIPSPSVMRELVDEFTGRTERAGAGLRVPTETEISHLTSMFPSMDREVVVGALQRSPNIEAAVETLLHSQS
ncbi:hypothetical protein HYPSUDRAFT_31612 [Hypholoma sublateritium FD-334 SS-4]|uniref:CUE domain-containing protein n=1 Tax=Hypholoma sublateritium (strain FD-334 SS-4) TaxID=945553 RepID=A0A0D2PFY1_HYPSF|nr:hypothetical protein HYPSUDRAFT_31612 [Hypholoma sublateritium FD-334 SS-4]